MSDFKNAIIEEKKEEKASPKMRVRSPIDMEEAEIKRLKPEDTEEVTVIMRKCLFSVTDDEVREVLKRNMSYGAYVGRMLVAVGLAWGTAYNPSNLQLEVGGVVGRAPGEPDSNEHPAHVRAVAHVALQHLPHLVIRDREKAFPHYHGDFLRVLRLEALYLRLLHVYW